MIFELLSVSQVNFVSHYEQSTAEPGVRHSYDLRTLEVGAEGLRDQEQPGLMRTCLKKKIE